MKTTFSLRVALLLAGASLAAAPALAATDVGVSVSINQPGVYGRIDIGNAPPPPLWYPQPVIIAQPAVVVQRRPIYLHVPPGHAKNWAKHCGRYNACAQPVYFVKYPGEDDDHDRGRGRGRGHDRKHKHDD